MHSQAATIRRLRVSIGSAESSQLRPRNCQRNQLSSSQWQPHLLDLISPLRSAPVLTGEFRFLSAAGAAVGETMRIVRCLGRRCCSAGVRANSGSSFRCSLAAAAAAAAGIQMRKVQRN